MSLARSPTQYQGVQAIDPPTIIKADRTPTTSDKSYPIGTLWIDSTGPSAWELGSVVSNSANWIALGSGTVGAIVTLTGDTGGAISPVAGNIDVLGGSGVVVDGTAGTLTISLTGGGTAIDSFVPDAGTNPVVPTALGAVTMAGTANQITTTGGLNSLTFSLPAAITAPGSLTTTTSLSATTTVTGGTGVTATTGNVTATAGAVNAGTSMTATAGDITATLGHIIVNGAAKQFRCHGGAATDFIGQATLVNGVATVLNTNIAATDRIFVSRTAKNASTAYGTFQTVITAATNFVITACKSDTTTETNDQSTVDYVIIRQV